MGNFHYEVSLIALKNPPWDPLCSWIHVLGEVKSVTLPISLNMCTACCIKVPSVNNLCYYCLISQTETQELQEKIEITCPILTLPKWKSLSCSFKTTETVLLRFYQVSPLLDVKYIISLFLKPKQWKSMLKRLWYFVDWDVFSPKEWFFEDLMQIR